CRALAGRGTVPGCDPQRARRDRDALAALSPRPPRRAPDRRRRVTGGGRLRLSVRHKLTLFSTLVILVVSSGFTWVSLGLARRAIEEDLQNRAIIYAREVAAAIGGGRALESGPALHQLIVRLLEIRTSVLQLDVLTFDADGMTLVASNEPRSQLSFNWSDAEDVQRGRVISRAVSRGTAHHWEVMAPITLEGAVAGAVAVKFSAQRSDELIGRIQFWALTLAGASLVLMGTRGPGATRMAVAPRTRRRTVAGAAAADAGAQPSDEVTGRIQFWALTLAGASLVLMGVLMTGAIQFVVDRHQHQR